METAIADCIAALEIASHADVHAEITAKDILI